MTKPNDEQQLPRDSKGEIILNDVFDAKVWAQEFVRLYPNVYTRNDGVVDTQNTEELMLAWFANAIMAGYDHAHREIRHPSPRAGLSLDVISNIIKKYRKSKQGLSCDCGLVPYYENEKFDMELAQAIADALPKDDVNQ